MSSHWPAPDSKLVQEGEWRATGSGMLHSGCASSQISGLGTVLLKLKPCAAEIARAAVQTKAEELDRPEPAGRRQAPSLALTGNNHLLGS